MEEGCCFESSFIAFYQRLILRTLGYQSSYEDEVMWYTLFCRPGLRLEKTNLEILYNLATVILIISDFPPKNKKCFL